MCTPSKGRERRGAKQAAPAEKNWQSNEMQAFKGFGVGPANDGRDQEQAHAAASGGGEPLRQRVMAGKWEMASRRASMRLQPQPLSCAARHAVALA